ncbi:MAG: hypothetical protein LBI64_02910, partial [Coriobacteriales bacterium]|nr:hypothetical protein [Coriobacteriales bacterium]
TFGDIEDPESPIALKLAEGTATKVGESGFYYIQPAGMPTGMISSKVLASAPVAPVEPDVPREAAEPGINPVIIGAGAVIVAAAAVGGGVAYSRSRKKADGVADSKMGGDTDEN